MARKIIWLFCCLFLAFGSCKKDTPPDYPSVQITAPYSMATYTVPASIQVTGAVSDANSSLTSVSVYIANSQNVPVEGGLQIPVTSDNMNVSCTYQLTDIHLASGSYYMTITVSNGTHTASAFKQIYVDAVPEKRIAVYAITRNGSGVHAWGIDSAFKVSQAYSYSVPGDYSSSDINSYYQQLYIAGHDSGNINVYWVPNPNSGWSIAGTPSPAPYFTNVYCNNDAEFISYSGSNQAQGYVNGYNHNGVIQETYQCEPGYYPLKTFLWSSLLFIEEKSISSTSENLKMVYETSGGGYNQTTIPGPLNAMYGFDNNNIFIIGNNSSGGGYIKLYNLPGSTFYTPAIPIAGYGNLLSSAQVNANTYLLGFSNGTIYQYTYNPVNMVPYIKGITASVIRYDSINNLVLAASGNTVNEYNYTNAGLITSATVSDSIRDLRILYNK